jgi:alkanesulfonate monooxygenase SsuD/methylene tetrahydromethanopterin reductase-like flavin-dependent oxidoreductase (luciferase family)
MGGKSRRALERIARLADGFFPNFAPPTGGWAAMLAQMRVWREQAGRDPADFGLEPRIKLSTGIPDTWRREAEEWRALGASHLSLDTMSGGLDDVEAHIARLAEAKEVLRDS